MKIFYIVWQFRTETHDAWMCRELRADHYLLASDGSGLRVSGSLWRCEPHSKANCLATNMFDHLPGAGKGQQPPIVAGGANDLKIKEAGPEGFMATYSGLNSDIICCSINGTVTVGTEGVFLRGDNYPSAEVIQYKPGTTPSLIGTSIVPTGGGWGANSIPGSPYQRAAIIGLPPPIPGSSGIIMAN